MLVLLLLLLECRLICKHVLAFSSIEFALNSSLWDGNIFLIVQLLVQFVVLVIQDDLNDTLQGVFPLAKEFFEGVGYFFEHERGWIKDLHHIYGVDIHLDD